MSSLPLQARSTTEVVDAAIQLYRQDPMRYMLLGALAYAPWVLLQMLVFRGDPSAATMTTPMGILVYLGMFVGFSVMSAALSRLAAGAYLGEARELDDVIREVLPRVPAVIGSTIVKFILSGFAFLLLFVPAFYVLTRYFATTQAVVLERVGVGASFSRSSALSQGLKWHIFITMALVWILYIVISFGAMMFAVIGGPLVVQAVSALVAIVAYPVIGITEVVLYYDARVRKEGYDIEVMAGALDGAPASI